jgi:hypothetical protein
MTVLIVDGRPPREAAGDRARVVTDEVIVSVVEA